MQKANQIFDLHTLNSAIFAIIKLKFHIIFPFSHYRKTNQRIKFKTKPSHLSKTICFN